MPDEFVNSLALQTFNLVPLPPDLSKAVQPSLRKHPPKVANFGGTSKNGIKREWIKLLFNGSKRLPGIIIYTPSAGFKLFLPDKSIIVFTRLNHKHENQVLLRAWCRLRVSTASKKPRVHKVYH